MTFASKTGKRSDVPYHTNRWIFPAIRQTVPRTPSLTCGCIRSINSIGFVSQKMMFFATESCLFCNLRLRMEAAPCLWATWYSSCHMDAGLGKRSLLITVRISPDIFVWKTRINIGDEFARLTDPYRQMTRQIRVDKKSRHHAISLRLYLWLIRLLAKARHALMSSGSSIGN